ncbi:MAG: phospholipase [Legionella sp.]|nr:MAG: phospholipase [Legionella sp.]
MPNNQNRIKISRLITLGDSLSDRGTLERRKLLGLIPMSYLSGLSDKSPRGRFTNGFLWGDLFSTAIAEEFFINSLRRKSKLQNTASANADIADEILTGNYLRKNEHNFRLNNDQHVFFKGQRFARYYTEGGLTSHNYFYEWTFDFIREFSRLILANLGMKREQLFSDDKKYHVSHAEKAETLVIEWSGANDLMTVNSEPNTEAVDKAVADRLKNIEQLVAHGYRNLVLFNLPDLSLTPRFKAKSAAEQKLAAIYSTYFNQQLALKAKALQEEFKKQHIEINLSVFDVHGLFNQVYANPEKYHFDPTKLTQPYTESDEFKKNQANPHDKAQHTSPAPGYMFWDDVHPTAEMHAWLAVQFKLQYQQQFDFVAPEQKRAPQVSTHLNPPHPREEAAKPLPKDLKELLKNLHEHANSLCQSIYPSRQNKGELLKLLIFEVRCQYGNLEDIHGLINAFLLNPENKAVIETHHNPIFDFFTAQTTTHSEDLLHDIQRSVKRHLKQEPPKQAGPN